MIFGYHKMIYIRYLILLINLLENNCSDREIYLYICIYGYLSKNNDLIYKYITYSLPLAYNYNYLLKYIK